MALAVDGVVVVVAEVGAADHLGVGERAAAELFHRVVDARVEHRDRVPGARHAAVVGLVAVDELSAPSGAPDCCSLRTWSTVIQSTSGRLARARRAARVGAAPPEARSPRTGGPAGSRGIRGPARSAPQSAGPALRALRPGPERGEEPERGRPVAQADQDLHGFRAAVQGAEDRGVGPRSLVGGDRPHRSRRDGGDAQEHDERRGAKAVGHSASSRLSVRRTKHTAGNSRETRKFLELKYGSGGARRLRRLPRRTPSRRRRAVSRRTGSGPRARRPGHHAARRHLPFLHRPPEIRDAGDRPIPRQGRGS